MAPVLAISVAAMRREALAHQLGSEDIRLTLRPVQKPQVPICDHPGRGLQPLQGAGTQPAATRSCHARQANSGMRVPLESGWASGWNVDPVEN